MISINVTANIKRPHPTEQFGSIGAMVSLQGEAGSLSDVPAVIRDLFRTAQAGADEHLAQQISGIAPTLPNVAPVSSNSYQRPVPTASSTSRPAPRRSLPGASDAQLRLLRHLLGEDQVRIADFCREQRIASLESLDVKRASFAIDSLKNQAVSS